MSNESPSNLKLVSNEEEVVSENGEKGDDSPLETQVESSAAEELAAREEDNVAVVAALEVTIDEGSPEQEDPPFKVHNEEQATPVKKEDLEQDHSITITPVLVVASKSRSETTVEHAGLVERNANFSTPVAGPSYSNNNCRALLPISSKNQMIPIALLRKSSACSVKADGSPSGSGGLMQMITGSNKVSPAVTNPDSVTTVGAAVLMLIPKKSDAVCIDMQLEQNQDQENNPVEGSEGGQQGANGSTSEHGVVKPSQSYDSYEEVCRICHDNPSKLELMSPCLCKGSMSKVHRTCLERWLGESAKNSCEICGYEYNTVRKPKFTGCGSVFQWIRHPLSPSDTRNLFFDIACFFILTPLAAISSWLCVVGAQQYTFGAERRRKSRFHETAWNRADLRADSSNATWTSVGLLSLTGTLLVAYSVWLFVAIKYHIQAWRDWQQRNFTVTIVPFEDGCMGRPPVPRDRNQPVSNNNNNGSLIQLGGDGNQNNNVYNFESNPNFVQYNSVARGRGRNHLRHGRYHRAGAYDLRPPIFSRSHFLRNPPPGYTISETTMLYQALYGSDSENFLNENILAFLADSTENVTEESSTQVVDDYPGEGGTGEQRQEQEDAHGPADASPSQTRTTPLTTHSATGSLACSSQENNNSGGINHRNVIKTEEFHPLHSTRSLGGSLKVGHGSASSPNLDQGAKKDSEARVRDDDTVIISINDENDDNSNQNQGEIV